MWHKSLLNRSGFYVLSTKGVLVIYPDSLGTFERGDFLAKSTC
jgi:hypothetical protein